MEGTHIGDEAAGADGVAEAHPLLVVGVVPAPQEVLAARIVGLLIEHPAAAVHAHRVAAAEVGLQVGVVAAALVVAALEAAVLVEGDLQGKARRGAGSEAGAGPGPPWAGSLPGPRSLVRGPGLRAGRPLRSPSPWLMEVDVRWSAGRSARSI